jgi:hypothetical protein
MEPCLRERFTESRCFPRLQTLTADRADGGVVHQPLWMAVGGGVFPGLSP